MNLSAYRWLYCAALVIPIAAFGGRTTFGQATSADDHSASASASDSTSDDATIKPYTGPPIYLDEPPVVAPPVLVRHETKAEKWDNGQVRIQRQVAFYSDNHVEADGFHREYYENGKPFVEGQYSHGRQTGEWTYYNENGTVNRKVNYENGLPDGKFEVHRADGTLMAKRDFDHGKRTGEWVVYDESGKQPLREEHYEDGKRDGTWKWWFPSGQLKQQMSFKDGQRDGKATEWNEDGTKLAEINYVDDKANGTATYWPPNGKTIVRQFDHGTLTSETVK